MSLEIPSQYLPFVRETLASGRFESEGALIGEALRLLQERLELRQSIQEGFDQINRGECIELDEDELDDYFEALIQRAQEKVSASRAG